MNKPKLKIAVFASGYGSNFDAITRACQSGELEAEVVLMVCDKPTARVNALADELGVERWTFSAKDYTSKAEYEAKIVERCKALGVELICLAGYMRLVGDTLMGAYEGRMINIHPSLLPSFAGKGSDIADPWYTGNFDDTYNDVVEGCEAFLDFLKQEGKL